MLMDVGGDWIWVFRCEELTLFCFWKISSSSFSFADSWCSKSRLRNWRRSESCMFRREANLLWKWFQALFKSWKHQIKMQALLRISSTCSDPALWSVLFAFELSYLEQQSVFLIFDLRLHFFIQTTDLTVMCCSFPAKRGMLSNQILKGYANFSFPFVICLPPKFQTRGQIPLFRLCVQ